MNITNILSEIRNVVSDYSANFGAGTPEEWLQDYLGPKHSCNLLTQFR